MLRTNSDGSEFSFLELIGGRNIDKLDLIKAAMKSVK